MSNPESPFESDPGYAAAKAFCDLLIETRDEINNTGTSLVTATKLERYIPGRIAALKAQAELAIGYPIKGRAFDVRSARDTDDPEMLDNIPRRSPTSSSPSIVGALSEIAVKNWKVTESIIDEDLLVVKIDPILNLPSGDQWEFYVDAYKKINSNYIGDPFGYYYPEPMSRWLRYQDIEELEPLDRHLQQAD